MLGLAYLIATTHSNDMLHSNLHCCEVITAFIFDTRTLIY